ncbi:MAG: hypothetical protein ABI083_16285 [Lapillicoccus sp.]
MRSSAPETLYWASTQLTVVRPQTEVKPLTLEDVPPDAVPAAAMLMQLVNQGKTPPKSTSPDATLYGEGKRNTVEAKLRDVGGQWGSQVPNPVIDIQVVNDNEAHVQQQLDSESALLSSRLKELQDVLAVVPSQRMTLEPPVPSRVMTVTGSKSRSWGSSLLIGLFGTSAAVYWVERLLRTRSVGRSSRRRMRPRLT